MSGLGRVCRARNPRSRERIHEHFGADPSEFPVVSAPLQGFERVNLQVALDVLLAEDGWSGDLIGLSTMHGYRMPPEDRPPKSE